jgi:uncharacterized repeat protein (TIGR02543 family)
MPTGGEMSFDPNDSHETFLTTANVFVDGEKTDFKIYNVNGVNYYSLNEVMRAIDVFVSWDTLAATITIDTSESFVDIPQAYIYAVTLNPNGGSVSPTALQTGADGRLSSLPTPTRGGGFAFTGWFTEGRFVSTNTVFSNNTTIHALWAFQGSAWAEQSVNEAIALNFVPMYLQSNFTHALTRAELCALAVAFYEAVMGREITGRVTFTDTNDINVEKAAAIGLVVDVSSNQFRPNEHTTREKTAAVLSRLAVAVGEPLPNADVLFSDSASISPWALEAVGQLFAAGIMSGVGNNMFSPQGLFTREQGIVTIMRLYHVLDNIVPPITGYFTITIDANGGSVSLTTLRTGADGRLPTLPMPTRAHHTFNGWFSTATGGTQITTNTVFTGNSTIHAQWTATGNNGNSNNGGND